MITVDRVSYQIVKYMHEHLCNRCMSLVFSKARLYYYQATEQSRVHSFVAVTGNEGKQHQTDANFTPQTVSCLTENCHCSCFLILNICRMCI